MIIGYEAKRIFHNAVGLGNFGRNLIRNLTEHYPGNQYLLYNPKSAEIPLEKQCPQVKEILPPYQNVLLSNIWRQYLLSDKVVKDRVDIFHGLSQELPSGLKKRKVKSVVSVHDFIFLRYPRLYRYIDRKIYFKKVKQACEQATRIVAVSEQTRKDINHFLKIPSEDIDIIYQSCNPVFSQQIDQQDIWETLNHHSLPEEFLLFVGTLERRKNPHLVLKAVEKLEIPAVLIGRPTRFWKQHLAKFPAAKAHLIHTPLVSNTRQLAHLYRAAKLFVYPSDYEGFGIPVLEAVISGTPVITSNNSSLPEVAGPSSILVNTQKPAELTKQIERVWQSKALQKELTRASLIFAENFADKKIAEHWNRLYQSLI